MLQLNYRDTRPIYEQVRDGLRQLLISGAIEPEEKLPSVRALATSLAINPNTIQKAYEALEAEGYVYSVPGKGSFASAGAQVDRRRQDQLLEQFDATVRELVWLGTGEEELCRRIREKGGQIDDSN